MIKEPGKRFEWFKTLAFNFLFVLHYISHHLDLLYPHMGGRGLLDRLQHVAGFSPAWLLMWLWCRCFMVELVS